MGLKVICTLYPAGKGNENTPSPGRQGFWQDYTLAKSLCSSFPIVAKRFFLCQPLAGWWLRRPLKPLGWFLKTNQKPPKYLVWKNKKWLSQNRLAASPSKTAFLGVSLPQSPGIGWKEKLTLYYNQQKELKWHTNNGSIFTPIIFFNLNVIKWI